MTEIEAMRNDIDEASNATIRAHAKAEAISANEAAKTLKEALRMLISARLHLVLLEGRS